MKETSGERTCVVGLGKIGLPLAILFAEHGDAVVGADIDIERVAWVNRGAAPFPESGLDSRLKAAVAAGTLRAEANVTRAVAASTFVFVLVRLVILPDGQPDFAGMDAAVADIARGLQHGSLVCFETTVPVGDTRNRFAPALEAGSGLLAGEDFNVCFSPERVRSGRVFRDLATYPKLVSGLTPTCTERIAKFYRDRLVSEVWPMSTLESAEFSKLADSVYRDANIALANELSQFADDIGIDFSEVVTSANSQPLSDIHRPGLGVGGHCIPVYPYFLINRTSRSSLAGLARHINDSMPAYAVQRIVGAVGTIAGQRILVLGLAFRGNVAETGFSVAVPLVAALEAAGARVRVHDPIVGSKGVTSHGFEWGEVSEPWADIVILQAAHDAYRSLVPDDLGGISLLFDGQWMFEPATWTEAGIRYLAPGRQSSAG